MSNFAFGWILVLVFIIALAAGCSIRVKDRDNGFIRFLKNFLKIFLIVFALFVGFIGLKLIGII